MWIIFALAASFFWGLTYILDEKIYEKVSVITSLAITSFFAFVVLFVISYFTGNFRTDIQQIMSSKSLFILVAAGTVTLIIAEVFIGFSISSKNATLAGLIEISYPIFIALMAYILYRENQLNISTAIGGGTGVYWYWSYIFLQ